MTNHDNKQKVSHTSIRKAGCRLDQLEWHNVERPIKGICA